MKVFLSHDFKDADLAKRVAGVLKDAGFEVWDYTDEIYPGDNWGLKLGEALQEANAMVVLLTPDALQAPNIRYEIDYALGAIQYKGRLIPVIAAPPEQLSLDQIPWVLKQMRWVRLSDSGQTGDGLQEIAQVLKAAA